MKFTRVYCPRPMEVGADWTLDSRANRHIVQVMRLRQGDQLIVFNGEGGEYTATIVGVHKRVAHVHLDKFLPGCALPQLPIHLGQAVSRGERMDYAIQKCTEMGVTEITPILSERCGVKIDAERGQKRMAHWQGVAISAAEQSGRCDVPTVLPICRFDHWASTVSAEKKWIAMPAEEWSADGQSQQKPESLVIAIGPEGGFTDQECERALQSQFKPVYLGPRVLRTETAGLVAMTIAMREWAELSNAIL